MTYLFRARLFTNDYTGQPLEVLFNESTKDIKNTIIAGTFTKDLTATTSVSISGGRRDGGVIPVKTKLINNTVSFTYMVEESQVSQLIKIKNKLNKLGTFLESNNGIDVDKMVLLEYEDPNNFLFDFKTRIGQHKKYVQVISMTESDAANLSDVGFHQGTDKILADSLVTLTCLPLAYGTKEQYGFTDGQLFSVKSGTILSLNTSSIINYFPNPSFSNDTLMFTWAIGGNINIRRLPESESLLDNDILVSSAAGVDGDIQYTFTPVAPITVSVGFWVKTIDGSAVTSNNAIITVDGSTVFATRIVSHIGDYYLVFATNIVLDVNPHPIGLRIPSDNEVIIAHSQLSQCVSTDSHPYPLVNGDLVGAKWEGELHDSNTLRNGISNLGVNYESINWLEGDATFNLWITPLWSSDNTAFTTKPPGALDAYIIKYVVDNIGLKTFEVFIDGDTSYLTINSSSIAPVAHQLSFNFAYGVPFMFTMSKNQTQISFYINAVLVDVINFSLADFSGYGDMEIGMGINSIIDGLMITDNFFVQGEVTKLYQEGLALKDDGETISSGIPAFATGINGIIGNYTGFNSLDTITQYAKNYAVVFGTNGNGESLIHAEFTKMEIGAVINRLVIQTIPTRKQFNYKGTMYCDLKGADATDDPASNYSIDDEYWSPRFVAGAFPKNSLQPGETFEVLYKIGGGGQATYSEVPVATQRPNLLYGEITILFRAIHDKGSGSNIFSTNLIVSYGGITANIITGLENPLSSDSLSINGNYVEVNNGIIMLSLKSLSQNGKDSFNVGVRVTNDISSTNQTFAAVDTIHVMRDAIFYLFNNFDAINGVLAINDNGDTKITYSEFLAYSFNSRRPLWAYPDKHIYLGVSFGNQPTLSSVDASLGAEIRNTHKLNLYITPTYKF